MIRVIHTGDLHLDSPFRGLSPEKARVRREEQRSLLEKLREQCEEFEADLLLIAGDLFDGDAVYYETMQLLTEVLSGIRARVFIAPGNHDPYSDRSAYARVRWPENVHIFTSNGLERVEIPELNTVVYGTAFTSKYRDSSPLAQFRFKYDEDKIRLLLLHADLSSPSSRYAPLTGAELAATGVDYAALGHLHSFMGVWKEGNTSFAYCGCPEGRGFDETGERGILRGTIDRGSVSMEFVPICSRRYEEIAVDVTNADPMEALRAALPADSANDIYRFRLQGRRSGEINLATMQKLLKDRFFEVRLLDETIPDEDPWARVEEDTLTGMFLRNMRARIDAASEEEQPALQRALQFGLAALEGREEPK